MQIFEQLAMKSGLAPDKRTSSLQWAEFPVFEEERIPLNFYDLQAAIRTRSIFKVIDEAIGFQLDSNG